MVEKNTNDADFGNRQSPVIADRAALSVTTLVYALQAVSLIVGVTFIAAVVINYVKRADVEHTWLASHFRWQIRTFWFALLWSVIGVISIATIGMLIFILNTLWVIYRIVRGWLNLAEGKPMYVDG